MMRGWIEGLGRGGVELGRCIDRSIDRLDGVAMHPLSERG